MDGIPYTCTTKSSSYPARKKCLQDSHPHSYVKQKNRELYSQRISEIDDIRKIYKGSDDTVVLCCYGGVIIDDDPV